MDVFQVEGVFCMNISIYTFYSDECIYTSAKITISTTVIFICKGNFYQYFMPKIILYLTPQETYVFHWV